MAQKLGHIEVPRGNLEHDHSPEDAAQVQVAERYGLHRTFDIPADAPPPIMATSEDEDRFRALMETDMRQAAQIDELRATVQQYADEGDDESAAIHAKLRELARSLSDAHMKIWSLQQDQAPARPAYNFKALQEFGWAVATVVGTVLLTAMVDVENVTDWKAWAIGVGAACVRAVLGLVLAKGKVTSGVEPPANVPANRV